MHVGIKHTINDARKWDEGVQNVMKKVEGGKLPAGMKPVVFLPATNEKLTVCVWEADSVDTVKKVIDLETSGAAHNEYFEVNTEKALGLPGVASGKN
jgi:hypothetical protein